jgi:hypothetical protein
LLAGRHAKVRRDGYRLAARRRPSGSAENNVRLLSRALDIAAAVARALEISDLIVSFDPVTLQPRPVLKREVVGGLVSAGDRRGARIVERLPERAGYLDADVVKHLLIDVHCEIQRLAEEFQHGQRMRALLAALLLSIPDSS